MTANQPDTANPAMALWLAINGSQLISRSTAGCEYRYQDTGWQTQAVIDLE